MIILIPAYQPDTRLAQLVLDLHRADPTARTVVVDDGSGPDYRLYFDAARAAGADVVSYPDNRGKGHALRTGLAHILAEYPGEAVVTADADGQHTVADILRVGTEVEATGRMVLGVREFSGRIPARSRIGNAVTALLFRAATGWRLRDTQTGLRGFPADQIDWLRSLKGDRYEYELTVLLRAAERGLDPVQLPIETIYEPGNPTSHFRPLRDSARIYAPLLGFAASSAASSVVDYVAVLGLNAVMGSLLAPVVIARVISCAVNYAINRRVLAASGTPLVRSAVRYGVLAVALLAASYGLLAAATGAGMALWIAKPVVDVSLFVVSYLVQKRFVFARAARGSSRRGRSASQRPADGAVHSWRSSYAAS